MMATLKTGVLGGVLVFGWMAMVCAGDEPVLPLPPPPGSPAPAMVAPNPYALAYYGYAFPRLGYVPYKVPYFALHPPVYYSYPVPRPYGYSPFAYPPGTMTPEVVAPTPVIIQNKFVPPKPAPAKNEKRVAQAPLRIANPYVTVAAGKTIVASKTSHGPQVIYPMAAANDAR